MKHLLLFIFASFISVTTFGQVCMPDQSFVNAGPGVYPFSVATPDCSDTLSTKTIVSITDTTVHVTSPIVLDVTIYYNSSKVVSVSNVPPGMSFGTDVDNMTSPSAPFGAWVNGGAVPNVTPAVGCVYVHGNPSAWQTAQAGGDTGVYYIQVEYDARIVETDPDVSGFGIPNGTWLSDVDPQYGGGTITIEVPMDTEPISDLVVSVAGADTALDVVAETYVADTGATSYTWSVTGGTIQSGQGTNEITVLWDGGSTNGSVQVIASDGVCEKTETYDVVVVSTASIFESTDLGIDVFPNPSVGLFTLQVESNSSLKATVLDLTGQIIHTQQLHGSGNHTIDLTEASSGVYMLRIETSEGVGIKRIIKL